VAARRCSSGAGGATNGSSPPAAEARHALSPAQRIGQQPPPLGLEPTCIFVKPSKALLSAHAPVVGCVTAAAGIVVCAVVSSKRASNAVSDISGRIMASYVVVNIVTGVVRVSSFRSRLRRRCRRATTTTPQFPVNRVTKSGDP